MRLSVIDLSFDLSAAMGFLAKMKDSTASVAYTSRRVVEYLQGPIRIVQLERKHVRPPPAPSFSNASLRFWLPFPRQCNHLLLLPTSNFICKIMLLILATFAKEIESKAIEINWDAKPGAWDCQDLVSWSSFYTFFEKTKERGPSIGRAAC